MKFNKNVKHLKDHTVTFAIYYKGKEAKLTDDLKDKMQASIQSAINNGEYFTKEHLCSEWSWEKTAAVFVRANRPKRFSPQQALVIRNDTDSIRKKSQKYNASTKTIQDIMKDRYY